MMGTPCFTSPLCQCIYVLPYIHLVIKFRNLPFAEGAGKQLSLSWAEGRVMVLAGSYSDGFSS